MSRKKLSRTALILAGILGTLALYSSAAFAAGPPIVSAGEASGFSLTGATLNGTVDENGAATTYKFEYGKTKGYGQSTSVSSVSGTGAVPVSKLIAGLEPITTYHFRISATNSNGTTISEDRVFEMLLSWRVDGKKLTELNPPPYYPYYHTVGTGLFTVETTTKVSSIKITCNETGSGVLGTETLMTLSGCKTFISGEEWKSCAPQTSPSTVKLNGVLATTESLVFTFAALCPLPQKLTFPSGGFVLEAGTESVELPVKLTEYTALENGRAATISDSSTWQMSTPYEGMYLGVS